MSFASVVFADELTATVCEEHSADIPSGTVKTNPAESTKVVSEVFLYPSLKLAAMFGVSKYRTVLVLYGLRLLHCVIKYIVL